MPRSKKPRKRYRPGSGPVLDPLAYMARLPENGVVGTQTMIHMAMQHLTNGKGTISDWRLVAAAINVATVLDENVFNRAASDEMEAAIAAHQMCGARHLTGKPFGFTGPEMQAVNAALAVHDDQLKLVTRMELDLATGEVKRRSLNPNTRVSAASLADKLTKEKVSI